MSKFLKIWCITLQKVADDGEKASAFQGLCALIKTNPAGAVEDLNYVCDAIVSWFQPNLPDELREDFRAILAEYKRQLGPAWNAIFSKFPEYLKKLLREKYHV